MKSVIGELNDSIATALSAIRHRSAIVVGLVSSYRAYDVKRTSRLVVKPLTAGTRDAEMKTFYSAAAD